VPETFAAARGLLQFGLQGTDIETFIFVAEGEEHESFEGMRLKGLNFFKCCHMAAMLLQVWCFEHDFDTCVVFLNFR
jgi:hypothetical protein